MKTLLLNAVASLLFAAPLFGATPHLEKVSTTPALVTLPMSIGGRVMTTTSESTTGALGSLDHVSQWPGSYFEAAFRGTEIYFSVGASHGILHVVVDDQAPIALISPEAGTYRLSGLADQPHSIKVLVVSESQWFLNHFGGFAITATEKPLAPPKRARQIEFIGDSHTVGYGNTSPKRDCNPDELVANTDDSQAFGPLVANHYHADYQINASSGRGLVRNYDGAAADTVLDSYPFTFFDKKQIYRDPKWNPQIIVIALGTNDFATALHPNEPWKSRDELHSAYEAAYVSFIKELRAKDPEAFIILWATDMFNGEIQTEVQKVIEKSKEAGEKKIAFIPVDHLEFTGCHYHPSVADDKTLAGMLEQLIDTKPQIWQGK